ncbi:MAG TPA: FAD-binding and (Fe-S)-binding domain-containing protein, partial [Acidimicrobiales bacterium]|nr:FAD-binding and (Fe-S)-binding domain-containing protein [Acidimicrobiales bacterium]
DASNYRVVPRVVVFPRTVDDILAVVDVCRRTRTPLTSRGGGTSIAGNAVGPGVVLDMGRHLRRVTAVDPDARTATVEPGVVLDDLQRAVGRHGLRFGPDPSTHARCTIGGMIGNNACGARALAYGTTAANVVALDVVDGRGERRRAAPGTAVAGLEALVTERVRPVAGELGRFGRQVSGYSLEHLLPERGGDLARALVGTEGTCAVVVGAEVALVEPPAATALAVLGYPDMATAADAVPALLAGADHGPVALEGLDARLVDVVKRHRSAGAVPDLPAGAAWLLVETGGTDEAGAVAVARRLAREAAGGTSGAGLASGDALVLAGGPGTAAAAIWRIREDGAGLGSRTPAGAPAWPAWEDAAVPPATLGAYLREFEALLADHGLDGLLYGHFGDGCVHVRIDLPLAEHPGRLRPFLREAAALVAGYGGSLSGEHGDGRARGELLPAMYSAQARAAFSAFKGLFDPDGILNPGVIVDPAPVDADLRPPAARPLRVAGGFALRADGGDLTSAVHRCVGVAKCRADNGGAGGFMCPSFLATGDERDSTRGRARVLQEMANGSLVAGGWRSPEVHDVLDLCLSCKACSRDCPVAVDMATYKASVLHAAYRRRLRPRTHYTLGWLPRWLALGRRLGPGALHGAARVLRWGPAARLVKSAAGIDGRRDLPALAGGAGPVAALAARAAAGPLAARSPAAPEGPLAVLWVDTFTAGFRPEVARAAASLLQEAGYRVEVAGGGACCALTWITTGQLDGARRRLRRLLDVLAPATATGGDAPAVIVGLEPSCTAVLRSDLKELLPSDPRAAAVAGATRTLAEALLGAGGGATSAQAETARADLSWLAGRLAGRTVVAQPHCHHHAVMGYDADVAVLEAAGASVRRLAGCCGLAGNFGMERGHYEVSVAVAEHAFLPALRGAPEGAVLLADGFSCRTQAAQLAGVEMRTLAEVLARPED